MHSLRSSDVFKRLARIMADKKAMYERQILTANAIQDSADATAMHVARNIGRIEGLTAFLEFEGDKE